MDLVTTAITEMEKEKPLSEVQQASKNSLPTTPHPSLFLSLSHARIKHTRTQ